MTTATTSSRPGPVGRDVPDHPTSVCAYCGAPATDAAHLSGRPAGKEPYFDPDLWVPSCHACNVLGYQAWEANGLTVVTDPLITRAQRVALSSLRIADSGAVVPVPPLFWVGNARLLSDLVDAIGRTLP